MKDQATIEQRTLDLISSGVDGELDTVEQEELARVLTESSEAREFNAELNAIVERIEGIPEVEPPQYLQESIERQIRLSPGSTGRGVRQGFLDTWLSARWLRTGFALAAGVVLTVGVYEIGSGPISEQDSTKIVGTVVKNQAVGQGVLLDRINISNDRLNGLVEAREKDGLFTLDVQIKSDGPTQVVVNFARRGFDFESITQKQDRNDTVVVEGGSVNVSSNGEQRYTLSLRRNTDTLEQKLKPLELSFYADSTLVHEAELNILRQ